MTSHRGLPRRMVSMKRWISGRGRTERHMNHHLAQVDFRLATSAGWNWAKDRRLHLIPDSRHGIQRSRYESTTPQWCGLKKGKP